MSHLPSEKVYRGFWVDHSRGDILGATITTDSSTATVVVAILSVLIKFAGTNLWQIIALIAFGISASISKRGGLHHQQQILLRNVSSPAMMLPQAWRLHWYWQRHVPGRRSFARLDLLTALATICSAGFIVAGVLSSRVVSTTDIEVLVDSGSCGFTNRGAANDTESTYFFTAGQQSIRYAHDCYNGSQSDPACRVYTTQSVPFTTLYDACPFDDDLCALRSNPALKMDTGLLWSNKIFGINARESDALALRQVGTCAPLNVTRYISRGPMDPEVSQAMWGRDPLPGEDLVTVDMGGTLGVTGNRTMVKTTYAHYTTSTYGMDVSWWAEAASDYFQQSPWYIGNDIDPIPPLRRTEGDLVLIGMSSNQHLYGEPIDDPFYTAHQVREVLATPDHRTTVIDTNYVADNMLNVIGCTTQYQLCKSETDCTRLTYLNSALSQAAQMGLSPMQNVTLYSFANALINYNAGYNGLLTAASPPFLAADGSRRSFTSSLPSNQWELEVKYWTAIVLSMLQRYISDYAIGQTSSETPVESEYMLPRGPHDSVLCHAQKMKAPNGVSNINVFGLGMAVGFSGLILVVNFLLLHMLRWLSGHRDEQWTAVKQWDEQEVLQVQRKAFESNNIGTWSNSIDQVPVVLHHEEFRGLGAKQSSQSDESFSDTTSTVVTYLDHHHTSDEKTHGALTFSTAI